MLKTRLASLDEVPEALHEHYTPHPNGGFQLDSDAAQELRTALTHERQHRKVAESRATELEEQVRIARGLPKPKPDSQMTPREHFFRDADKRLEALQRGSPEYVAELAKIEVEGEPILQAELAQVEAHWQGKIRTEREQYVRLRTALEATSVATELAIQGSAPVLIPLAAARIGVQEKDGEWVLSYRDAAGHPTTREGLAQEFRENPALERVIQGASPADKAAHARKVAETLGATATKHH